VARRFFVVLVSIFTVVVGAAPSRAQPAELSVTLIEQPIWHTPGDPLGLRLRLSNTGSAPVEGYLVTVAAHGRVLSRSALHQSFTEPVTFAASLITAIEAPAREIGAGESVVLEVTQPVGALQSLADTTASGVYPLQISVLDGTGATLATTSTQLIYYPTPPEFRLPTVPIVPIAGVPRRGPDGTFGSPEAATPLGAAVAPRGWLTALVRNLDRATTPPPPEPERRGRGTNRGGRDRGRARGPDPEPRVEPLNAGVVVMPRLAEELSDMADGYRPETEGQDAGPASPGAAGARQTLEALRRITGQTSVQPMLAPYAFPDLPTLFDAFPLDESTIAADHLEQQLRVGEAVLQNTLLEAPSRTWIYTPSGRLGHVPLEELQELGAAAFTFFAEEGLEPRDDPAGGGCPEPPLSFACPIEVTTSVGTSAGYVLDRDIQGLVAQMATGEQARSALQRFFSETAMIREEVPSRTDRVVAFALPGVWEPPPRITRLLLEGLRDAPWLRTFTPRDAFTQVTRQVEPVERRIRFDVSGLLNEFDDEHFDEIARAHRLIESFRTVQPPPPLLERLTRNVLVSESVVWARDAGLLPEGKSYAEDAAAEAERELAKVTIGGRGEIALTSRRADIPVLVFNDADYDVSVTVRITSADLRLDETFRITVQAHGLRQLSTEVAAQSSGIFTVDVVVETPNGREIARSQVQVRSTEFNEIALGLTFGALAFLVLFYITRAVRLRGRKTEEERAT